MQRVSIDRALRQCAITKQIVSRIRATRCFPASPVNALCTSDREIPNSRAPSALGVRPALNAARTAFELAVRQRAAAARQVVYDDVVRALALCSDVDLQDPPSPTFEPAIIEGLIAGARSVEENLSRCGCHFGAVRTLSPGAPARRPGPPSPLPA